MSSEYKTTEQMLTLARRWRIEAVEVAEDEYRLTIAGEFLFQGRTDRCGDFLQGYERRTRPAPV